MELRPGAAEVMGLTYAYPNSRAVCFLRHQLLTEETQMSPSVVSRLTVSPHL